MSFTVRDLPGITDFVIQVKFICLREFVSSSTSIGIFGRACWRLGLVFQKQLIHRTVIRGGHSGITRRISLSSLDLVVTTEQKKGEDLSERSGVKLFNFLETF
ncbi:unnamed protein product [Calypogeia fissa]